VTEGSETNPDVVGRDRLQDVSYDPFGLMPRDLPPHPRVLLTRERLARTKRLIRERKWARTAMDRLIASARSLSGLPDTLPVPADPRLNAEIIRHALHNGLAHLLTGRARYRNSALAAFRLLAVAYLQWPILPDGARAYAYSLADTRMTVEIGQTYDLLAAAGLDGRDDGLFRELLAGTRQTFHAQPHRTCGNHNTWGLVAGLSVAIAAGDRQWVHDALYGCDGGGGWRYGLVHQLRHDILSDGLQWERGPGYHFYTLMGLVEMAWMLRNVGVDIWHVKPPTATDSDGQDLHRAYGPEGETKCLKAAFDAPLYATFANRDLSLLHDSGLANLRGVWVWGPIYELAYEAYRDPRYAWVLNVVDREYPEREHRGLPMSLHASRGVADFVRLNRVNFRAGRFSLTRDCAFSLTGRHVHGCTLFATTGQALLRAGRPDEMAPAAYMFWGPHSAGHQSPASLHVDLHAQGRRLTDAPRSGGYEDSLHLTWVRTTIAHNTVTVDERAMFPCDQESESIWEADSWRERPSDGTLELFQPEGPFKAVRASNANVYPDVRLDRTVILGRRYVLDVFRVLSSDEHLYDWAMHCLGRACVPAEARETQLGERRGYRHFSNARELPGTARDVTLEWAFEGRTTHAQLVVPAGGRVVLAEDPDGSKGQNLGELRLCWPRSTVVVRARGRSVLFASLWQWAPRVEPQACLRRVEGGPDEDVSLEVSGDTAVTTFRLPMRPPVVRVIR